MSVADQNCRAFTAFRVLFNARFYYPVFAIVFVDMGLTLSQFAMLNVAWAVTILLAEVPSGALSDIVGRRRLLIFAGALMVVEMLIFSFAPTGDTTLLFWLLLFNRVLSGLAEAAASGADEAITYDALIAENRMGEWASVLARTMRRMSIAFFFAMLLGAAVYDPDALNQALRWCGWEGTLTQETTLRFPLYLTLATAVLCFLNVLRFREPDGFTCGGKSVREAFALTMRAGKWLVNTPFALGVVLAGMFFDGVSRMFVTIGSEYYRLLGIPEVWYGVLGALFALMKFVISPLAQRRAEHGSVTGNFLLLAGIGLAGFAGVAVFRDVWGLVCVLAISAVMTLTTFFASYYLNAVSESNQRATVLSFKGLAMNLSYGFSGVLFAGWMEHVRSAMESTTGHAPESTAVLDTALGAFPWFFGGVALLLGVYLCRLKKLKS